MAAPQKITVLFSSAGRRVELINCFRADAAALGRELRAVAVDLNPEMSPACAASDRHYPVPRCTEATFIDRLLEICAAEKVHLVVPTIDTELETLAASRERFLRTGARVAVSTLEVVRLCRNKFETARSLGKNGIPAPKTGAVAELLESPEDWRWPILLKPIGGSSSAGVHVVHTVDAARSLNLENYVAQEMWTGKEYTVNLYFDAGGRLRCTVPHQRVETRSGEVSKGITERQPTLMALAEELGKMLRGAYGPLCFQAMITPQGQPMVFEINARFGGGYPLAHRAGACFSRWLLEDVLDLPGTAHNNWHEGLIMLRYDAAVFVRRPWQVRPGTA